MLNWNILKLIFEFLNCNHGILFRFIGIFSYKIVMVRPKIFFVIFFVMIYFSHMWSWLLTHSPEKSVPELMKLTLYGFIIKSSIDIFIRDPFWYRIAWNRCFDIFTCLESMQKELIFFCWNQYFGYRFQYCSTLYAI